MTDKDTIYQLSIVIADQRKQIESLESTNDYLRKIDKEKDTQIADLIKQIHQITNHKED